MNQAKRMVWHGTILSGLAGCELWLSYWNDSIFLKAFLLFCAVLFFFTGIVALEYAWQNRKNSVEKILTYEEQLDLLLDKPLPKWEWKKKDEEE